jgi:RHH-type proline utilization regulon transcriptional repressor/proline dehydrogenase/delta 1-pyrroline-5-carboxylate dehydrogenase
MTNADAVEARTQEIGRALLNLAREYRPSRAERLQDDLLLAVSRDRHLQHRLLGFVDVLSGLGFDRSGRRTRQLAREYLGERFPQAPLVMRMLLWLGTASFWPSPLVGWAANRFAGFMASRFIVQPGESSLGRLLHELAGLGRAPSFDLLGEQVLTEGEAESYADRYVKLIGRLAPFVVEGAGPIPQVSLKLSSLTPNFNPHAPEETFARVAPRLDRLAVAARRAGVSVTIDAEHYEYRDLTWFVFRSFFGGAAWRDWDGAGIVVQAYLRDAAQHAAEVIDLARRRAPVHVRLVKGAYWDYEVIRAAQEDWPVPVHTEKDATDAQFEAATRQLLGAAPAVRLAVGSHNLRSHAHAEAVAEALGLPSGSVEHQTLYRTAEGTSRALAAMGWPARDYVPIGELLPAMAYLARRILENASQSGFLLQSRLGESEEDLLRAPAPSPETAAARPASTAEGSFVNQAPPRLFRSEARDAFARAYEVVMRHDRPFLLAEGSSGKPNAESPDPAGGLAGRIEEATLEHARRSVERASGAAASWVSEGAPARAAILRRAADLLLADRDYLSAWVVREGGKAVAEAYGDVDEAIDYCRYYAYQCERLPPGRYVPRGVVAVIPPWNFPIAIPAGMTAAALAAGNAVILKPAEETPIIARLLVDRLHAAGVPGDVLAWLPGDGDVVGRYLVECPDVDMVAFTGSRAVGEYVFRTCAGLVTATGWPKAALTETGGKNPVVVCADADMDEAVRGVLHSAFAQANQKCSAASRVLVERPVFECFVARLGEAARSLVIGTGASFDTFIPPVISDDAATRIREAAATARREGRMVLNCPTAADGRLLGPLIVTISPERAPTSATTQEEIFGPVLAVIPFDDIEDALRTANEVDYGLTSGVYTRSRARMAELIAGLDAGHVYVNRETVGARVAIEPFGGHKLSGTGPKAGSDEYLWAFVRPRDPGVRSAGGFPSNDSKQPPLVALHSWRVAAATRLAVLQRASTGCSAGFRTGLEAVLPFAGEISRAQPTRPIPGQRNYVDWSTPRGRGIAAFGHDSTDETIGAFVAAALLAGNGLAITGPVATQHLASALLAAGVPPGCLVSAGDVDPAQLAGQPFHFATGELDIESLRGLRVGLAENRPQVRAFRPWIGADGGPLPGEPGFVRRFALPKTVAINTLRHAVDLGM